MPHDLTSSITRSTTRAALYRLTNLQQLVIKPGNDDLEACNAIPDKLPVFAETYTDGWNTQAVAINNESTCPYAPPLFAPAPAPGESGGSAAATQGGGIGGGGHDYTGAIVGGYRYDNMLQYCGST